MPWAYASRDELKRRLGDSLTTSDAIYKSVQEGVARAFDDELGRTFRIYTALRYTKAACPELVLLDADLLSLTLLRTDLIGLRTYDWTWAVTDYDLNPDNAAIDRAPYWEIRRRPFVTKWFPVGVAQGVEVTGKWGYWEDLASGGTLGAAIVSTSATSITLTSGHSIESLHTILIDSEQMYVTATTATTATVERGANGTTAATHLNAAAVQFYRYPPSITEASLIQASRIFRRKDAPFGVTGAAEFGVASLIARIDPDVKMMIQAYRYSRAA